MAAAFCPKCGTQRVGQSRYCPACAFDFEATAGATPVAALPPARDALPSVTPTPGAPVRWESPSLAPAKRRGSPVIGVAAVVAVGVLAYLVLNAGSLVFPGSSRTGNPVAAGWTRSANYTTCDQWATQMTQSQRETMASELLPILRRTVDTAADNGAALVPAFVGAISATCQSSAITQYEAQANQPYVITAAATLAFTQNQQFRP